MPFFLSPFFASVFLSHRSLFSSLHFFFHLNNWVFFPFGSWTSGSSRPRALLKLSPIFAVSCPSITSPLDMASAQEEANALKVQGNKAFAQHDWPTAVDFYNQAIEKYDQEPSFFSNRAQVRRTPTTANLYRGQ